MAADFNKQQSEAGGHIISMSGEVDIGADKSDQEITVHTMPKRFQSAQSSARKSKGIGLLVIVGGIIILMAAAAFVYFYLLKPKQELSRQEDAVVEQEKGGADSELSKQTVDTGEEEADENSPGQEDEKEEEPEAVVIDAETESALVEETESEEGEAVEETEVTTEPVILETAADSDGDGLADTEEVLFGSNSQSRDSDGDGYEDLAEILNLYNPTGSGKIIVNNNIEKYINSKYNYSLYYPFVWPVEEIGGKDSIIFKLGNNQFIQVIIQDNDEEATIEDWYKEQMGLAVIKSGQVLYKTGWQGVKSEDGLTVYLTKPESDEIIIISYNLGVSNILNYRNIFEMMIKSLEIGS
jgi:hypothetical protein